MTEKHHDFRGAKSAKVVAALVLAGMHGMSFALGGLDKATSAATDVKSGLYGVVGVLALIYMTWLGAMAFTEKKSWSDFGWGAIHVSVVGGSLALAGWAWSLFA